jgi:hypothetical protein
VFKEDGMGSFRKLGAALVFAGVIASGMGTFSTTVHAAGPGYCRLLPGLIQSAIDAGADDLAAALQAVYDANCQ